MPAKFDKCVKEGGEVRTLTGPRTEKPKLKADEYIHVCIAPGGGRYWSYKKKKKTKKELKELLCRYDTDSSCEKHDKEHSWITETYWGCPDCYDEELKKALVPSDIPELLTPGGIPAFQDRKKKRRKKRVKKIKIEIPLEDVTSKMLQKLSDVNIYEKHREVHKWWNESDYDREDIKNVHKLIVQEFGNKEMIHHSWDSLDA